MKTHIENKNSKRFEKDSYVTKMRQESIAYKKEHRVWLYYDAYTVEKDNGYFQFANDKMCIRDRDNTPGHILCVGNRNTVGNPCGKCNCHVRI